MTILQDIVPPGRERRACCDYLNQSRGLSPLPQGKTTTPNYSLEHARPGSDRWTASNSPLICSTSPLQTVAILSLSDFHKISRAEGPKRTDGMRRPVSSGCDTLPIMTRFLAQWKGDRL